MNTQLSEILQLSVAERIQLVEDIWDSIASVPEAVSLTEEQQAELDRRLELYQANPSEGISWKDLKEKLRQKA
jgi:putative addiction module component (TIGR02574 family)